MTSNHRRNCQKAGTIANLCSCNTINNGRILALKTPQYGKRSVTLCNVACQLNAVTWICFALKSKWSYVWQNCSINYGESYSLSEPQTTMDYALVRSSTLTVRYFMTFSVPKCVYSITLSYGITAWTIRRITIHRNMFHAVNSTQHTFQIYTKWKTNNRTIEEKVIRKTTKE